MYLIKEFLFNANGIKTLIAIFFILWITFRLAKCVHGDKDCLIKKIARWYMKK